jgi:hypothetical protein
MDIEIKAKCSKCTIEFFMCYDTHGIEWGTLGGMCPHCNAYVIVRVRKGICGFYPPHNSYKVGQVITPVPYHAGCSA